MRTRKPRRNHVKRHSSDPAVRMMTTQAGRWVLLPGGGFGLRAPSSWDGKYPA
jgi:hypothetical protein